MVAVFTDKELQDGITLTNHHKQSAEIVAWPDGWLSINALDYPDEFSDSVSVTLAREDAEKLRDYLNLKYPV